MIIISSRCRISSKRSISHPDRGDRISEKVFQERNNGKNGIEKTGYKTGKKILERKYAKGNGYNG